MLPRLPLFQLTRLCSLSRQTTKFQHNYLSPPVPVRSISTTPAPQYAAARIKVPVVPHRDSFISKTRFTQADIPDLSFWLNHAVPPLVPNGEVTPAQCLEACARYVALATENAPGWQKRHLSVTATSPVVGSAGDNGGKIPFFTLHYAAVTLLLFADTRPCYSLVLHILTTGAALGYAPSVLDLARIAHRGGSLHKPQFERAREGLARLVAAVNNDPTYGREYRLDTLTLAAQIQLSESNTRASTDRAVRLLEEAFKTHAAAAAAAAEGEKKNTMPTPTTPIWEWRTTAVLTLSQIYLERKQVSRARDLLGGAAAALDQPEVYFRYAMLLEPSDPRRRELVQKAAVSGVEEAAREMARQTRASLKEEEEEEGLSGWERKAREAIAYEWAAIAGDEAILE
ncbi:uncharacterized protein F4812DRAFT_321745 [Daldinia caldariorum]|uniref:uncharacterized protein n=1 Tax=Daldinia caldariorum TaxID=326644 RepID=UPI002008D4A6|nr:uncharacterized protein F4812DRAFT_321745 [Daldinia caldariorum]KAI1469200.1 hypothetical protein F4812DRAFT_321745 [Daldinia caldariorum]